MYIVATTLLDQTISLVNSFDPSQVNVQHHIQGSMSVMTIHQGAAPFALMYLSQDQKITLMRHSCARKIPGLLHGIIAIVQDQRDTQVQIQTSALIT